MESPRQEGTITSDPSRPTYVRAQLGERICPFLGLASDPETAAAYARSDHRCSLPGGASPVLSWQNHYCLVAEHVDCPQFQRARDTAEVVTATPPDELPTGSQGWRRKGWTLAGLAVVVIVIVAGVLAAAYLAGSGPGSSRSVNRAGDGTRAELTGQRTSIGGGGGSNSGRPAGYQSSSSLARGIAATPSGATPAASPGATVRIVAAPAEPTPVATATPQGAPARFPRTTPVPATPTPKMKSPTPPAKPKPKPPATYTVKSGDTLTFIAQQFHTSIDAIAQLNKIPDPDVIATGLVLKLPSPTPTRSP